MRTLFGIRSLASANKFLAKRRFNDSLSSQFLKPYYGIPVKVKAYYLAQRINLTYIQSAVFSGGKKTRYEPKCVTVEIDKNLNQYISVYKYGSVVLFNVPEESHQIHLNNIQRNAVVTPIINITQHTEDYTVMINPQLEKPSVLKAEHVNIRALDYNNIAIISSIISQSVALDYYAVTVDNMLDSFMKMNMNIEETGSFVFLQTNQLYKLVAINNRVNGTVLSKLGIFEGCDAAWENADNFTTWEELREDFEIESRYKDLSLKLDIVKDNTRFFLEILHNQKSTKMEIIIIVLIGTEIVIGLMGLFPVFWSK